MGRTFVFLLLLGAIVGCGGGSTSPVPQATPQPAATPTSSASATASATPQATPRPTPAALVSTIAGLPGSAGSGDGSGTGARFNLLAGAAVDMANGDIYVTDTVNCTIRQVTPAGVVTTVAGVAGACGATDGTGSGATFNWPQGIAYDPSNGDLYVTDTNNCEIRQVTVPGFAVATIAGTPTSCALQDGTGGAANLNSPAGITFASADNNLYVTDTSNCAIRRVTPGGTVTTIAGGVTIRGVQKLGCGFADGSGANAELNYPNDIAFDGTTNDLYVTDAQNCMIRQVTLAGSVTTIAGSNVGIDCPAFRDGSGGNAAFSYLSGIAYDSKTGTLYVTDTQDCIVREVTVASASQVSTVAGSANACGAAATWADGTGPNARLNFPSGITFDSANGFLYVTDTHNDVIRQLQILSF